MGIRFPLTDAQAEKWLGSRYSAQASLAFVEAVELVFEGALDVPRLQVALDAVVARHQAFAVRFERDGQAQVYEPAQRMRVGMVDLSDSADPLAEYSARCERERATPFDPAVAPLVRACLYRLAPGQYRMFMAAHHLVFDGWSLRIVLKDLAAHYNATTPEQLARIPPADSWAGFARAERARRDGPEGRRCLDYWLGQFRDLPESLRLPTDRPRTGRIDFSAASFNIDVDPELWQGLRRAARGQSATRFALLLAAYFALMHRLSGQTDLVCGVPFAGAAQGGGARLVGDTDNTLPLRVRVDPSQPLQALVGQVQQKLKEAAAHQDVSLGRIVDALPLQRDAGRMLLVESIVTLVPSMDRLAFDGVDCRLEVMPRKAAAWELGYYWRQLPGALVLEVQYQREIYDPTTIHAWTQAYLAVLEAIAAEAATPVADLDLAGPSSRAAYVLADEAIPAMGNAPSLPALLQPAFGEHADRCAAECGEATIDYAALDRRSRRLAAALVAQGVARGELVGVAVPRSLDMLVAVLAVLRAGAAYVPLDPAFPVQRLRRMVEHSGLARIIAADAAALPAALLDGRTCLSLGALEASGDDNAPLPDVDPDDLAYVLYTSGSTGEPKGVRILHRNLVNFLCAMRGSPGFSRDDAICAATTLSFDIAALELYLPLLCGGRVVIATEDEHRDPEALCRLIERRRCTVFQTTPSMMALVQEVGRADMLAPLRLLVGGEPLPLPLARTLAGQCRGLWNMYGPTETTVWSSVERIEAGTTAVSLGQPIARTRLYVLDARRRPALPHAVGEIWIGGAGVADGYLHRSDLTAERFVPDPFVADGSRMYRTGDLGRLHDGRLYFHGRVDDQIKLRGYRIEPGDIEAAVAGEVGITECAVAVRRLRDGDDALVLYVATELPEIDLVPTLRAKLSQALPAYMRPQFVEVLERLPRTPNGKIDRRALPSPSMDPVPASTPGRAPRNALESELCALWQRLLRCRPVSVDDDFFALGGSSLLAVRMFAELHRRHGVDLPLATLLERPTVAALAEALSAEITNSAASGSADGAGDDRWHPLLCMQPGDASRLPLFLFHAVGGNVLNYHPLLDALGVDQPVYGLQSIGLDGTAVPHEGIGVMADAYAEQIERLHPSGPLLLAGGSMGGIIALEVARRLRTSDRTIAMLAMFDTHAPGADEGAGWWRSPWAAWRALSRMDAAQWADLLRRLRLRFVDAPWARVQHLRDPSLPEPLAIRLRRIESANHQALSHHVQQRYDGDVELFRAPLVRGGDGTLGWKTWIDGDIRVHELPGSHHDFIARPELGRRLREGIAAARGTTR
ncbi:amino acid adenylation domain-containing protein [Luteimonas soli]|uniref:Amino acid adenylation domain-containing protein n=1 Tax=Luteimonas soli TaxID=1648966 RepID=A0ABV7XGH8_9GAMM